MLSAMPLNRSHGVQLVHSLTTIKSILMIMTKQIEDLHLVRSVLAMKHNGWKTKVEAIMNEGSRSKSRGVCGLRSVWLADELQPLRDDAILKEMEEDQLLLPLSAIARIGDVANALSSRKTDTIAMLREAEVLRARTTCLSTMQASTAFPKVLLWS